MSKIVSFEEIRKKYSDCNYEPRDNCKYCNGTGIIHKKTFNIDGDFPCICIFVQHDLTDLAQNILNETISRMRQ
jgi:hypothetical protein